MIDATELKFGEDGLIPVITRDARTGEVLMLAYMNAESLRLTQETGQMHYFSRSRQSLWMKGETSGNIQQVKDIKADCDRDALLATVEQTGVACHTGSFSCFCEDGRTTPEMPRTAILKEIFDVITDRKANPKEGSYTNYLFDNGVDKILKKIGEESTEVIIAAKNKSNEEVRYEMADLIYHLTVLMVERGLEWDDIFRELEGRR